ncbi:MAG: hypothetical protein CR982_10610 [Candidatus Cloacimonadota bacterium]|nr:MAG: hypothetical protein CR982_10610 [Candidatus Cloacimonadota bacterium]PIE77706.1 MAG: hypothetical protein CSA15_11615 [Candidatus Delongbacteria bacterium]
MLSKLLSLSIFVFLISSCSIINYGDLTIKRYKERLDLPPNLDSVVVPNRNLYLFGVHAHPSLTSEQELLLDLISKQKKVDLVNEDMRVLKKDLTKDIENLEKSFKKDTLELYREKKILKKEIRSLMSGKEDESLRKDEDFHLLFGLYESEKREGSKGEVYFQKSFLWGLYEWKDYD